MFFGMTHLESILHVFSIVVKAVWLALFFLMLDDAMSVHFEIFVI